MTTTEQATRYGLEDLEAKLRVVLSGLGPGGEIEELTRVNGDGTGQIVLEYYGPTSQATTMLDSATADDLLTRQAAKMGSAKPGFELETPTVWAVQNDGELITRGRSVPADACYRRRYRFNV